MTDVQYSSYKYCSQRLLSDVPITFAWVESGLAIKAANSELAAPRNVRLENGIFVPLSFSRAGHKHDQMGCIIRKARRNVLYTTAIFYRLPLYTDARRAVGVFGRNADGLSQL